MSITLKSLLLLLVFVLPFQKRQDKCLIIRLEDNTESYELGTTGDSKTLYYLTLKYPDPKKNKEYKNPLVDILAPKNPTGVTFSLRKRAELKNLPDKIDHCNCATVKNFNLGIEFKVYIEKPNGWTTFDAKNLLVRE